MGLLTLNQFFGNLPSVDYTLDLTDNVRSSRSQSGMIWTTAYGQRLWVGSVTTATSSIEDHRRFAAIASSLTQPGNYFQFTPKLKSRPLNWTGVQADFDLIKINGIVSPGHSIRLKGLPPNFRISIGDFLSFNINGCSRLYEVAADAQADISGICNDVTLTHPITHGAVPIDDSPVYMSPPLLTCQIVPGSLKRGSIGLVTASGMSFDFIQSIRR